MTFRQSSALESQSKKQPATFLSRQRAFQVEAGESVVVQGTARWLAYSWKRVSKGEWWEMKSERKQEREHVEPWRFGASAVYVKNSKELLEVLRIVTWPDLTFLKVCSGCWVNRLQRGVVEAGTCLVLIPVVQTECGDLGWANGIGDGEKWLHPGCI